MLRRRSVAVFGSSEPREGEAAYRLAHDLGRALAGAGYEVVTGGYGGVMEAANRGAVEAGGATFGVTCEIFDHRDPNPFLKRELSTRDLHDRTRELIVRSHGFVVLPGKSGTLSELAFLWALDRAGCLGDKPLVLLGELWPGVLRRLEEAGILEARQRSISRLADDPGQAIEILRAASEELRG